MEGCQDYKFGGNIFLAFVTDNPLLDRKFNNGYTHTGQFMLWIHANSFLLTNLSEKICSGQDDHGILQHDAFPPNTALQQNPVRVLDSV